MKTGKNSYQDKRFLSGIFIIMSVFLLTSCSKNFSFLSSSIVPAARGDVKVKTDNNKNYVVEISLTDLAEPSRLQPPKLTYIVWMVTNREITKNIGQLKSARGIMSKQLKGSFKTVTADKPVRIYITAEDDAGIEYPGTQIVLSTDKFNL